MAEQQTNEEKNYIKKFLKLLKKPRVVSKIVKLDESKIKNLDPHLLNERAQMQGIIIAQNNKLKEFQEQIKSLREELNHGEKEKDIIVEKLHKDHLKASMIPFKGALSLTKLFSSRIKENDFDVLSYDMSVNFGKFNDIIVLNDGRLGIEVITKKKKVREIILISNDLKHLFRNISGITKSAERGYLIINLDKDGNYVENFLEEKVPRLIRDKNNKVSFSQVNQVKVADLYVEIEAEKQFLYSKINELEESLSRIISEMRLNQMNKDISVSNASSAQASLIQTLNETKQIQMSYDNLTKSFESRGLSLNLKEEEVDILESAMKEALSKIETTAGKPERERAQEDYRKILEWAKFNIAKPVVIQPTEDTKSPLEKQFDHEGAKIDIKRRTKPQ